MSTVAKVSLLSVLAGQAAAFLTNGLAVTPQMGWDNWNAYGCSVSQDLLLETASRMTEIGLAAAGYEYVILDDCWSDGRFPNNTLKPDATKFPNGMAYVADYIHSLGMKYGMYSSAGIYTCAGYPGSLGLETTDADTFAGWGVDYLKYDNCYNQGQSGEPLLSFNRYDAMSKALNATGRYILYSMCQWGEDGPWQWAQTIANSWRTSGDIWDSFNHDDARCPCSDKEGLDCKLPGFHCSMVNVINKAAYYLNKGSPGAWNDLDMLEVGNGGMTDEEYKAHFTLWAGAKSPLIMGTDVTTLSAESYSIYMNPAVIAINQDPLGSPMVRRYRYFVNDSDHKQGEYSMFSGDLYGSNQLVVLFNAAPTDLVMNATLADIFNDDGGADSTEAMMSYDLFDLWGNRMSNATADAILASNSTTSVSAYGSEWLNATETSYADALAANSSVVLGKQIGTVAAGGTITATIPGHGIMAYRLRPQTTVMRRDEL